jgi:hypothetical protein
MFFAYAGPEAARAGDRFRRPEILPNGILLGDNCNWPSATAPNNDEMIDAASCEKY